MKMKLKSPAWTKLMSQLKTLVALTTKCQRIFPLDACPFHFKDIHNLPCEGINPHRLRIGKDVLETEMIQMSGLARASGILLQMSMMIGVG